MKLYELMAQLSTADLEEAEIQRIEYDPKDFDMPSDSPVAPTYTIYWEHMSNGDVIGGTIEVSESLFKQLALKYDPIPERAQRTA